MKKMLLLILLLNASLYSQNTVGIINNTSNAYEGYTLFAPNLSTETYLINNCGEVINQWSSTVTAGNSVYLLENGNLLRAGKVPNNSISFGGVGGKVELFDWDSNLLWEYTYSSNTMSQHHDVFPMPNGNVLMLAVTTITAAEAVQAGRDPNKLDEGQLYNEQIIELEPVGINQANIVWEWNIKDHLIQDFDNTKDNYGVVADNPQLLNINYLSLSSSNANWLHFNSIQYNESLDQIVMSSRHMNEIYIIDHSTTTAESASNTGGNYNKGGDFLYRWGNREAYNKGTLADRTLNAQHFPHWIPDGLTDAGKIMIFNNGNATASSSIDIINPGQSLPGVYDYDITTGYSPLVAEWRYQANPTTDFFSAILSSGQRLPNGNTLICDGDSGYFFEIDTNDNKVWEYISPVTSSGILNQGDSPAFNNVFRVERYSFNYPAFIGKNLTPTAPIEGNPDLSNCTLLSINENSLISSRLKLSPNPVKDILKISYDKAILDIEIYNAFGKLITTENNTLSINFSQMNSGLYLIKVNTELGSVTKKIVKE